MGLLRAIHSLESPLLCETFEGHGTKSQAQLRERISLLMASFGVITEGLGGKLRTIGMA